MFTPDSLFQIALDAQAQLDAIPNHIDWSLVRRRDEALHTAAWMEQHGVTEAVSIGPFGNADIKQGTKVRVRKGAKIGGTGTNVPDKAGATYTVEVVSIDAGSVSEDLRGEIRLRNQTVHWAGRGGYWRWTDVTNVEPIQETDHA